MKPFEDFLGRTYVTIGVHEQVPENLRTVMLLMIMNMDVEEKDSYQFFKLYTIGHEYNNTKVQVIEHWQEEPEYHSPIMYIPDTECYTGSVYVIDDGENCVMCFPDER